MSIDLGLSHPRLTDSSGLASVTDSLPLAGLSYCIVCVGFRTETPARYDPAHALSYPWEFVLNESKLGVNFVHYYVWSMCELNVWILLWPSAIQSIRTFMNQQFQLILSIIRRYIPREYFLQTQCEMQYSTVTPPKYSPSVVLKFSHSAPWLTMVKTLSVMPALFEHTRLAVTSFNTKG